MGLADALNELLLICSELLLSFHKQPGGLLGRHLALGQRSRLPFLATHSPHWLGQARSPVAEELTDQRGRSAKALRLDLACELQPVVRGLLPALAQVGQVGIGFGLSWTRR